MGKNTNLSYCNKALSGISQETNADSNETHNPEQIINWLSIPLLTKNIEITPILINDFNQDASSQALPLTAYPNEDSNATHIPEQILNWLSIPMQTASPERTNEDSNETHNPEQILDWQPIPIQTTNIEIIPILINDFDQTPPSLTASSERGTAL